MTKDMNAGDMAGLLAIMARLRDRETGCPWDIEQSFVSIAPYTIEEAYEVADAIERADMGDLKGELGDLLLQVVYHAQMAREAGQFGFSDVVAAISAKMIDRHPHVFGEASHEKSAETQSRDWEAAKAAERRAGALAGVARGLPALTRAVKLQNRAARVGFDWPSSADVLAKIAEETVELEAARASGDAEHAFEEFGDLLFVMANLARHYGIDPEAALRSASAKFERRFAAVEVALAASGKRPEDSDLAEMDGLWDAAKAAERAGK